MIRLRFLAVPLAVLSMASTVPAVHAQQYAAPDREYEDVVERLEETRRLVRRLEQQERGLRSGISAAEARRRALEIELEELSAVVDRAQGRLDSSEAVLSQIQQKLDEKTAELEQALRQLQETHDLIQGRAVRVYKSGPASFFDVLLGAESFGDMVTRFQGVVRVFRTDEIRLTELRELKARVQKERDDIQELRDRAAEQVAVVRRERDRVASLQNAVAARRNAVAGELSDQYSDLRDVTQRKADYIREQQELEAESRRIAGFLRGRSAGSASVGQGAMTWPTSGPVTSGYGWRTHPIFGTRRFHSGIDIGAATGAPVVAGAPGTVIFAGRKGGYGNTVIVDHGGGVATLYGHLSSISRGTGAAVGQRQAVGRVGCSGYCTGPHLHFEVRVNGEPQNPMAWLS